MTLDQWNGPMCPMSVVFFCFVLIFFFNNVGTPFFLYILLEKHGVSEQRIAAREKLSRLLQNQLQDLSTDVYDELKRRTDGAQGMCSIFIFLVLIKSGE